MKDAFCARHQDITPHKVTLDPNGDFVFTCQADIETEELDKKGNKIEATCLRFFKLAGTTDPKDVDKALEVHQEVNVGQVNVEGQEAKLKAIIGEEPEE